MQNALFCYAKICIVAAVYLVLRDVLRIDGSYAVITRDDASPGRCKENKK